MNGKCEESAHFFYGANDASAARFELLSDFDDQDFDALIDDGTFVE